MTTVQESHEGRRTIMLVCLLSYIIITIAGCMSKTPTQSQQQGSAASTDDDNYLNDLMYIARRKRRDSYISCSQSPIQNNMTLKGGIAAGYFRKLAEHVAMQLCVELCCEDKGCDVAFMTGKSCYGVQCFNEELCRAFPAKREVNDPVLIAHVTFKGEKVVPKDQTKEKLQCASTRIKVGVTLRGGLRAGNFTDIGTVEDMKVCVNLCCVSESCNVAMMINDHCFLVSCFNARLCQMRRSVTPLYQSSLAYVQKKTQSGKHERGNISVSQDASESQLVCKNSKIFYNSTLKGGYHAGNYTNLGQVANISSCIRWCCGNRDCDAAFMLENNCFAVACRNPDDCLPVHAKSSSSSAALKPRISYITSRSEEVSIMEEGASGGVCHAGIVSYDVTLRGGRHAGKFTPHGIVHNMKTCIYKCCQSEGCSVAMMLKDSCFTVVCESDEKCEKKQSPISSHFNPRIAYVFRDNKAGKPTPTQFPKKSVSGRKRKQSYHHETLKHRKKMLLIQQLHALTSPRETPLSSPREPSLSSPEGKYSQVTYRPNIVQDDPSTVPPNLRYTNKYTSPTNKYTAPSNKYTTPNLDEINQDNFKTVINKYLSSAKEESKVLNNSNKRQEFEYITQASANDDTDADTMFPRKFKSIKESSKSALYDFLRGNLEFSENKLNLIRDFTGKNFTNSPTSKNLPTVKPSIALNESLTNQSNLNATLNSDQSLNLSNAIGISKPENLLNMGGTTINHTLPAYDYINRILPTYKYTMPNSTVRVSPSYNYPSPSPSPRHFNKNKISSKVTPTKKHINSHPSPHVSFINTNSSNETTALHVNTPKVYHRIHSLTYTYNHSGNTFNLSTSNKKDKTLHSHPTKSMPPIANIYNLETVINSFDSGDNARNKPTRSHNYSTNKPVNTTTTSGVFNLTEKIVNNIFLSYNGTSNANSINNSKLVERPPAEEDTSKPVHRLPAEDEGKGLTESSGERSWNVSKQFDLTGKMMNDLILPQSHPTPNSSSVKSVYTFPKPIKVKLLLPYNTTHVRKNYARRRNGAATHTHRNTDRLHVTDKLSGNHYTPYNEPVYNISITNTSKNVAPVNPKGKTVSHIIPSHTNLINQSIQSISGKSKNHTVEETPSYKTNIKLYDDDASCFRSSIFYNRTLRGGYDSGKFRDRGKMKDVIQCATLCCHLARCDLVMMLSDRCFSVDCRNARLCEAISAKSPIYSPTICYVRHV